ncbi:glycosyltransferase family 31 protein [Glonium stellatum]|uniref:Glycosyltransferase family 31 protein n=1 Tax=Glonium stellatum TaxID=574774 RepID=A0A8E2F637_9PEZI|nr:glycosyltransferase family 31 protein [Glonium stellatum]
MLKFIVRRRWQGLIAFISFVLLFSLLSSLRSLPYSIPSVGSSNDNVEICNAFPIQVFQKKGIQVLLKTGIGESPERIRAHLASVTSCVPPTNLLIFSDNSDPIGDHEVIDVLAGLPAIYKTDNPDFLVYEIQKAEARRKYTGFLGSIDGSYVSGGWDGWKLDRFKFLPMIEKAVELRPHAAWYLILETDTYVFWENLFEFLSDDRFSPLYEPLYLGAAVYGTNGTRYALGGSGFLLSRVAVEVLVARLRGPDGEFLEPSVTERYADVVKEECCGDIVLGRVFTDKNITLSGFAPMFNTLDLENLGVSERNWCLPLITMDHVRSEHMDGLWRWERNKESFNRLPLHHNLLDYTHPTIDLEGTRLDWDSLSGQPTASPASDNATACAEACETMFDCLQYSYSNGVCNFDYAIRLGHREDGYGEYRWISGWDINKISRLKKVMRCELVEWRQQSG